MVKKKKLPTVEGDGTEGVAVGKQRKKSSVEKILETKMPVVSEGEEDYQSTPVMTTEQFLKSKKDKTAALVKATNKAKGK